MTKLADLNPDHTDQSLCQRGRWPYLAIAIFSLAVGARLIFAWVAVPYTHKTLGLSSLGVDGYWRIAKCVLDGVGYRFAPDLGQTLLRLPGYPLFLCAVWGLVGIKFWAVQLLQALLAGGTCLFMLHLGSRYFCRRAGILAGLGYALWPVDWVLCSRMTTECLTIFFLTLSVVLVARLCEFPRLRLAVVLGLVLGIAALIRESLVLVPMILLVGLPMLPLTRHRRLTCLRYLGLVAMIAVLAVVPWVVYGYAISGSVVLPCTGGGFNLYQSVLLTEQQNCNGDLRKLLTDKIYPEEVRTVEAFGVREQSHDFMSEFMWTFKDVHDEVKADRILKEKAMEKIYENPIRFTAGAISKVPAFWFRGFTAGETYAAIALFVPLLLLAFVGAWSALRSGQMLVWPIILLVLYFNFSYAVAGSTNVRYSAPVVPLVMLLSARGLCAIGAALANSRN